MASSCLYRPLFFPTLFFPSHTTLRLHSHSSLSPLGRKKVLRPLLLRFSHSLPSSSQTMVESGVGEGSAPLPPPPLKKELWLFNTMSRKKELFRPKVEGRVGMYVCGVTAYDLSHIGHARVYVTFDVLYRSVVFVLSVHKKIILVADFHGKGWVFAVNSSAGGLLFSISNWH